MVVSRYWLALADIADLQNAMAKAAGRNQPRLPIDELPNIAISISQGLLHRLLFQIVAHTVGPEEAPAVYDGLTCF